MANHDVSGKPDLEDYEAVRREYGPLPENPTDEERGKGI